MSVAFRRESDEEHLEPRFELPIPPGPNLVTARGQALIAARIDALAATLSETGDEQRINEIKRDLRYWRARQASARLTPPADGGEAGFGTRVTYKIGRSKAVSIDIVGQDEADPAARRLAFTAPLARAVIGTVAGDVVEFGGREMIVAAVVPIPE